MKKKLFFCLMLFLFSACSVKSIIPENLKNPYTVYLSFFKNITTKPKINEIFSLAVSDMLITSDNLKLVEKHRADYIISGVIKQYLITDEVLDIRDIIQLKKITVSIDVTITPRENSSAAHSSPIEFNETISTIFTETSITPETELQALDRLKKLFSIKLYNHLLEKLYKTKK